MDKFRGKLNFLETKLYMFSDFMQSGKLHFRKIFELRLLSFRAETNNEVSKELSRNIDQSFHCCRLLGQLHSLAD